MHDLGIVLEDQYMHVPFKGMLKNLPTCYTLVQAEQEAFGFDHTQLGFRVAEQWNLPASVCEAIRDHHTLHYDGPNAPIVACVELANVMCSIKGVRSVGISVNRMGPSVVRHLNVRRGGVADLVDRMFKAFEQNQHLLRLVAA